MKSKVFEKSRNRGRENLKHETKRVVLVGDSVAAQSTNVHIAVLVLSRCERRPVLPANLPRVYKNDVASWSSNAFSVCKGQII